MDPFIQSLQISARRFSNAVRTGPLDAPIAACPGWNLTDLTHHLGMIHRWARLAAMTSAPPDQSAIEPPPATDPFRLADWIDAGVVALVDVLQQLDPAAPTWHPFPIPRLAAVWPRRQAHETQVHAWDAERAVGATSPLEPDIALDGVAEYFEVIAPRVVVRSSRTAPTGTVAIDPIDAQPPLIVSSVDGAQIVVSRSGDATDADVRLTGRAEDLLLALWGRAPLPAAPADRVALEWLTFGGN
jgi:uncharacterized protein (TIGR03083 family)